MSNKKQIHEEVKTSSRVKKIKYVQGQYFTKNILLKEKLYEFILNKPNLILEPSIGRGDLISYIKERNSDIQFDMFEIDKNIKLLGDIDKNKIIYGDFLIQNINKKYKTIVGNPPYIRTKKGNLYIDFIEKCYNLLDENGELIFIVPSDFIKLTSASKILTTMFNNGMITHIYHPNNEKLFDNASIDVIIFRYCKNKSLSNKILYNDKIVFINNSNGLITFSDTENKDTLLFKDIFNIYVGIVSGKEEVYKNNDLGNIEVINGENKKEKYIFINSFPSNDEKINNYLLQHKSTLLKRNIRNFNEKNWFEWGAARNLAAINNNKNKKCIYIYNLSRKEKIAFIDKVGYFGGGLIMMVPTKECDLDKIINYLNSDTFKQNFMFSGRFKIGHRQISNSIFPNELS